MKKRGSIGVFVLIRLIDVQAKVNWLAGKEGILLGEKPRVLGVEECNRAFIWTG